MPRTASPTRDRSGPGISPRLDTPPAPASEHLGVEAVLLGEPLHGGVDVVGGAVRHVEVGGLRVRLLAGLGADVLVVHAQLVEDVAYGLDRALVPHVGHPQHRLSLHGSPSGSEVVVGEAAVLLYELSVGV